jgi:hypothetical protein
MDIFVKVTVRGITPLRGAAVKLASTGMEFTVMQLVRVRMSLPAALLTANVSVYRWAAA